MALRINHKDNSIQFNEAAAPATPPGGTAVIYIDSTSGNLAVKDDTGAVTEAGGGLAEVVDDATPVLGGNLNTDGNAINTIDVGSTTNSKSLTINIGDIFGSGAAGTMNLIGSDINVAGTTTNAGNINISGGSVQKTSATGFAGNVAINGGAATAPSSAGDGGEVNINGGDGSANGGDINVTPGDGISPGRVNIRGYDSTSVSELAFFEASTNEQNFVAIKAPTAITANVTWTLPQTTQVNAVGNYLKAAASGILSFEAAPVENPMTADLDVGAFRIIADADTYLTLDDTTTTLHAGGALGLASVGAISIFPDSKTGTGAATTIKAGISSDAAGGDLNLTGGNGTTIGGDIVLAPGSGTTDGDIIIKSTIAGQIKAATIKFRENNGNGTNSVGLKAPAAITADVIWTLPQDTHINADGKFITSDASGVLSFGTPVAGAGGATTQIQFNNAGALDGSTQFTRNAISGNISISTTTGFVPACTISNSAASGQGLSVNATDTGAQFAISAICASTTGDAVVGHHTATTGAGFGVRGISDSSTGKAGYFENTSGTDTEVSLASVTDIITGSLDGVEKFKVTDAGVVTAIEVQLTEFNETANSIATTGAVTLDPTTGSYFYNAATTGIITFTFSNPAASGRVSTMTLELFGGGTNAPVWPASVKWPGNTEPTWSTGIDLVTFVTRDAGTTWLGMLGGTAFA